MSAWNLVKAVGGPGSLGFLALVVAIGAMCVAMRRWRRLGRWWLAVVAILYLALSLPATASVLVRALRAPSPLPDAALRHVDALVVFDGDNRIGRIREALRVCRIAPPRVVWLLGSRFMTDDLLMGGVPRDRIRRDDSAADTRTQVALTARLFGSSPGARVAILVSRLQAPRVVRFASAIGLDVTVVPSPLDVDLPVSGVGRYVPSYQALTISRDAIYELAAGVYYGRS